MNKNILWIEWSKAFSSLRGAFSRESSFCWAMIFCAGMILRTDHRGVGSTMNAFGLKDSCYNSLLRVCHSSAINLDRLIELWIELCLKIFTPNCIDGYAVIYGDGIKVTKEGKKMPAVKSQHQESASNSKAEFIMGHFLQAFSLSVLSPLGKISAIPLFALIHDGLVFSNRSKKPATVKFGECVSRISTITGFPSIVVADAYYSVTSVFSILKETASVLVSRVAHNTVAYNAPSPKTPGQKGRPRKIGEKIKLRDYFDKFKDIATPFEEYLYYTVDLYWPSAKQTIRFVLSQHPSKGRAILISSSLHLSPEVIIRLYSSRWLIETGFKHAIHVIGTFAYHFWSKAMKPIKRGSKNQYLHKESQCYTSKIRLKMKAYHLHVVFGCIAQGLLIYLGQNFKDQVWWNFKGWIRTINKAQEASELVVSNTLRTTLPTFLLAHGQAFAWVKMIKNNTDPAREGPLTRAA